MKGIYSSLKAFRFPDRLAAIAEGRLPPPIHVRLKPTNRCGHRCSYCCFRTPGLPMGAAMDERDEIPEPKLLEIADDLASMGVAAVTLSGGGDPLCHPAVLPLAERLLSGGVALAVLTNGSRLEGPIATALAARASWVRVSMDAATPGTYAAIRGVARGEFDRVCANVAAFAAMQGRKAAIGLNYVVTRENAAEAGAFVALARGLGAAHVKLSAAVVSRDPAENAAYQAPFFEDVKRAVAEARARSGTDGFRVADKVHAPDSAEEGFRRGYATCPTARLLTVIAADASVYSCQDKAYEPDGCLGSIRDRRFADFWLGGDAARALDALRPDRVCGHHCVAHGKNLVLLEYLGLDPDHAPFV